MGNTFELYLVFIITNGNDECHTMEMSLFSTSESAYLVFEITVITMFILFVNVFIFSELTEQYFNLCTFDKNYEFSFIVKKSNSFINNYNYNSIVNLVLRNHKYYIMQFSRI